MAAHARLKIEFTEGDKCLNLMSRLKLYWKIESEFGTRIGHSFQACEKRETVVYVIMPPGLERFPRTLMRTFLSVRNNLNRKRNYLYTFIIRIVANIVNNPLKTKVCQSGPTQATIVNHPK